MQLQSATGRIIQTNRRQSPLRLMSQCVGLIVSPAKQKRDIGIAFPALTSSAAALAA